METSSLGFLAGKLKSPLFFFGSQEKRKLSHFPSGLLYISEYEQTVKGKPKVTDML